MLALGRPSGMQPSPQIDGAKLADTIHRHRNAFCVALQLGSQSNGINAWLIWFADIVIEAQARTITRIRFLIDKTRLLDRLRGAINERQEKALLRIFREGPDGFAGGLSAGNCRTITGANLAIATRELNGLIEKGGLFRTGERRYARYRLVQDIVAGPHLTGRRSGGMLWKSL